MPVARGRAPVTKGLQQVEYVVARSKAEGLYDILQGAIPSKSLPYLLAHLCPRGTGGYLLLWSHA